jgi:transaldolase/glucose-6-phosphate isomerase
MNPLKALRGHGQSPWLDFMKRSLIGPTLDRMIAEDGLGGITSNPAIFEKAIGQSTEYDAEIARLLVTEELDAGALYERLAIADIQAAADALLPVYQETRRRDGYVSLEVSPHLADDTEATLAEARRLWATVDRPNLMVKVPATQAGIPAVETLIAEGINVNITLLFDILTYEQVAEAYLTGLERRVDAGQDIAGIASVASFFVSRIDAVIDEKITQLLVGAHLSEAARAELEGLHGKTAIANAKLAYQRYGRTFAGPRWEAIEAKGAQTQRLLWASTGVKNPAYPDTLYVETLIGPDTVNTLPPATMDAFRDHGQAAPSIEDGMEAAAQVLRRLPDYGISLQTVADKLLEDGLLLFADAFDALLGAVEGKRRAVLANHLARIEATLPAEMEQAVAALGQSWRRQGFVRRLWNRDESLWSGHDEARWLGWLDAVAPGAEQLAALKSFAGEIRSEGVRHVLLIGMGGSSLGPEVLAASFGAAEGHPQLQIIDSTDPAQIRAAEAGLDYGRTLFIVASKSGSTLEPTILMDYFFARATEILGQDQAARHFVAVTDPGSKLEAHAKAAGLRHIFPGEKTIGGRFSVLSNFGLVPAAAIGIDIGAFLASARLMAASCGPAVPPPANPGVQLGLIMGVAASLGRDKLTVFGGPGLESFGAWAEQLVAESTGKDGKGIIPVDGKVIAGPEIYGTDRLFVHLALDGKPDPAEPKLDALVAAGHPVVRLTLGETGQLGQEFFRWEIATSVAGACLGINPFDQPDVEAAKIETRKLTEAYEASGHLPEETPILEQDGLKLYADPANKAALGEIKDLDAVLVAHFRRTKPGDYIGLLAYVPRLPETVEALAALGSLLESRRRVATCPEFGPRFLHSTGQAYKGGPNSGVFLQITGDDAADLPVPGRSYSFGIVEAAQAGGDLQVLVERGRRALRVHLGSDPVAGLKRITRALEGV